MEKTSRSSGQAGSGARRNGAAGAVLAAICAYLIVCVAVGAVRSGGAPALAAAEAAARLR